MRFLDATSQREPELRDSLERELSAVEEALGYALLARLASGRAGARTLEVWCWNERVTAAVLAKEQGLSKAVADIAARIRTAHSTGLLRDALDVLEYMERQRTFTLGGWEGEVLRFAYRLQRPEAIARLVLSGRNGLLFLDDAERRGSTPMRNASRPTRAERAS